MGIILLEWLARQFCFVDSTYRQECHFMSRTLHIPHNMTYLCDSCGLRRVTFTRVYALVTASLLFISYLTVYGTTSLHLAVPRQSQVLSFEAVTETQTMRMPLYLAGPLFCQPPGSHIVCVGFHSVALSPCHHLVTSRLPC